MVIIFLIVLLAGRAFGQNYTGQDYRITSTTLKPTLALFGVLFLVVNNITIGLSIPHSANDSGNKNVQLGPTDLLRESVTAMY